jgi:integrase
MEFTTLRPMLASIADVALDDPAFVYEPRYDGFRVLIAVEAGGGDVRLFSRRGNDKASQFPDLVRGLKQFSRKLRASVILDGEIVALSEGGAAGGHTPEDVVKYRAQRVRYKRRQCPTCEAIVMQAVCRGCGWKRHDKPLPISTQTVNHDHMTLIHMFNVARSPQFKLMTENPAAHVPKPNPLNERDRIATQEEWEELKAVLPPHVRRFLTVAYDVGPRRGELSSLEWCDVDLHRKEFTLRQTKNGEVRMVPMTPAVYHVFTELRQARRLDTSRVFLYKGKPIRRTNTAFKSACRRAGITNLRIHDFRHTAVRI